MEAPTGVSLGAVGSLLRKLDALLLAPGCRLPKRVKDGVHLLKDDLEEVSAYLEDLAEVEDPPLTAKCWMKSVRELSYDFEDYIDKFPRAARGNVKTTRFVCKIIRVKNLRIPKRLKWHQQMANMVSEFRMYVQEAIERYERYGLDCGTSRRRFVSVGPMLPAPYEETADLVIDGRMSEFVNSLANDGDQQLKVVSVLGPGCIGKTTLVGVLYNILGGQFDCRAFIRVSRKPDMKRLFSDVLSQVQGQQPRNDCKELDLIHNIRTHLQDKRYLIVFDDLWAASVWDIINHAFPEGTRRSRIITTTQIEDVALTCCCYRSEYVFEMKPLDNYHSRKLFFDRLFCSRGDCPQKFKEVSNEIVGICGGLPLATISIASLLASQPVILMDLLTYIRDSLSSYLWTNSTSEETRQILNLSYNNLPHYLKTCLLYLSMYPEGSTICKDDLVKQWLAEGFIDTTEGRDMEKVAGSYFDELIYRRFIQPIGINYNDEVLSCTVHDVVHDLIAYKSAEENFIVVVDYYRKNVALSEKVRRLSLHFGDAKYAKTPANIRTSQVRSLTFFGLFLCMPSITEFKLLRVLNLQLYSHCGDDTVDLTGLSELFQLRYLKITCDVCIDLPNHMRGLQYLETLHIDTKVSAVPWDIFHLPRLLHLRLPVETNLSDLIGSTRSVSVRSLGKLNNLQDLHLTCSTPAFDLLERNMEALGSLLGGLGSLETLALVTGTSHKNDMVRGGSEVTVPWDGLAPPLLLQRFEWLPQSCIFSRVPKWIGELGNLRILKISVKELLMNGVDTLRGLPALTALSLYVQVAPVQTIVFDKAGFSVLKYFKFRCSVSWLKFEADAMPSLRKLKLGFNAAGVDQHGTAPISIEHLPGLKEISVEVWGAGADAESALRVAVSNHRSNPRINVQLVDCPFFGDESKSMGTDEQERRTLEQQYEILEEDPGKFYRTQAEVQDLDEVDGGGGKRSKSPSPQPYTPDIREAHAPGARAAGCGEQNSDGGSLIGEIGRDLSIKCLLQLSRSEYGSVASLSRDFRSLVRAGEIYRLRREKKISEHWVYFSCNGLEWVAYDPYRERWISVPKMPADEYFMCSDKESLAVGTELLVFGMAHIVFRYSILTNSWTRGEGMNAPRCLFGSASVGEKAYVAGGTDSYGRILNSAELYNSETHTWTSLPAMNRERKLCSGVFMDSKFYVIGGVTSNNMVFDCKKKNNNMVLTCGEEYDIQSQSWKVIENMSEGLNGVSGAPPLIAVVKNELYAADYSEKDVKKYDKQNNKWVTLGKLPERSVSMNGWGLAFRACGERLIVIGGQGTSIGGMIELNSWIPDDKPPVWNLIARRPCGEFVYDCSVMGC